MNWWMCQGCSHILEAETPPEVCPECRQTCNFGNVTCYIPECGGPSNIDARLVNELMHRASQAENPFSPDRL